MSKLILLFCVALAASATHAAAHQYSVLGSVQKYIDEHLTTLQKTADKFQTEAEEAMETTKGKVTEMEAQIKESTDELIQNLEKILAVYSADDVKECHKYMTKETIEHSAEKLSNHTKDCVDRYSEGNNQIRIMSLKAKNVIVLLNNIKFDAERCVRNVTGHFQAVKFTRCIASAKLKAGWEVTKRIPNIIRDQVKLTAKLHGIPEKVANCLAERDLEIFRKPIQQNLKKVESCVTSLVEKKNLKMTVNTSAKPNTSAAY